MFAAVLSAGGCERHVSQEPRRLDEPAVAPAPAIEPVQVVNYTTPRGSAAGRDWCVEHGVPESRCGLCSFEVAADAWNRGNWCHEHERPKSQCFICRPQLRSQFAASYREKYSENPPESRLD